MEDLYVRPAFRGRGLGRRLLARLAQKALAVDGFLAVNEKKLAELPDDKVLELFRTGLASLIEMHRISMSNMSRLVSLSAAQA